MKLLLYILTATFVMTVSANCTTAQSIADKQMTVVFYNVENLFDTIDDPLIDDDEFTPNSEKNWTEKRYQKKLEDISKIITSINQEELPELIGLAEVENKRVMRDMLQTSSFKKSSYGIVHYNSPDQRGIDVALLYRNDEINILSSRSIPVSFPFDTETLVRDILYAKGTIASDTLHMFVNHWKSRYGGKEQTEKFRVFTARVLKSKTDSILQQNKDAKIIAIGDFNDEPLDKSLQNVLEAQSPKNIQNSQLYNLLMPEDKDDEGTYNYKYEWYMLDNFIVSGSFLKGEEGYTTQAEHIHIYRPDWILFEHPKAGMKIPNRTYGGPNYYGGFSDHLPIYGIFQLNQN